MGETSGVREEPATSVPGVGRSVPEWLENLAAVSWRVIVVIAFIVVVALLAYSIWTVTAAILLAIVVAAIFSPLVLRLRTGGRSRTAAAGIGWLAAIGIIGGLLLVVVLAFLPHLIELGQRIDAGTAALDARLAELNAPAWVADLFEDLVARAREATGGLAGGLASWLAEIGGILIIGTFLLFFVMRDGDKGWLWLFQSLGPDKRELITTSGDDALRRIGGYLRGTAVLGLVLAALSYVFLLALDIPASVALAILTFGMAFVPYFGGFVSGLAILVVTFGAHGVETAALMALLLVGRGLLAHAILRPRLFLESIHMHPAVVLVVLPIGFELGGLLGLFLAVPVTAGLVAAVRVATTVLSPTDPPPLPRLVPAWLDRAAQWSWRALVALALIALLVVAVTELPLVLIPLILALIFTATLQPLVEWLVGRGQGRSTASALVVGGTTVIIVGVLALAMVSLVAQASELGATAVDGAEEVNASAGGQLGMATEAVAGGAGQAVRLVVEVGTGLAGLLTVTILSVLLTFFFLRDGAALWRLAMTHTRASAITPLTEAGRRSIDVLGGYMIGTGAISVVGAFSQLVIMWLLNLPLALPVFVLSFFGGFIPYIGSALTTLLALLIAIAVGDPIDIVIMLIWTVVFNIVQGNIVAPIVYGRTAHIHPAIVLAAIPAASSVAGIAGMFIVVPAIGVVAASWRSVLSILSAEPTDGRRGDPAHDERSEIDDEPADEAVPQPA